MIKTAELLSVGTELLLGEIVDTNSAYLASSLAERGVDVYWSQRVGDNLARITGAIMQALARSDLLVVGGGLGPTDDDMTREAIAGVLGEEPKVDAGLERSLREKFAQFSRHMPENNLKQCWLIPSAGVLDNPIGTAPGWFVQKEGKTIIALPGPPRELKKMWEEQAIPRLQLSESFLFTKTFKTLGLGESGVAEKLGDLTKGFNPSVATYAKKDGVHVRVAAKGKSALESATLAQPALETVEQLLSDITWGYDNDELPKLILASVAQKGLKVATLESFTGGMLAQLLSLEKYTSLEEYTNAYAGGVVAYPMQASVALSYVLTAIETFGVTSLEVALAMARAAAELFHTDLGLAITGLSAGVGLFNTTALASDTRPDVDKARRSVTVHVAVHGPPHVIPGGQQHRSLTLPQLEPEWLRERASYGALALLWTSLKGDGHVSSSI
ncbi:MAG: CinA family nicotinamide mononucleotide deamidase-related protein [Trueperaceae bacterium]